MAKKKIDVKMYSYGEYEAWDRNSKEIPKLRSITNTVGAQLGTEFGYVLHIKKAKGSLLRFCIEHPPFCDESSQIMPPFTGELYINTNDYRFFLGDFIWAPLEDKMGPWKLSTWIDDERVAEKTLQLVQA
jgi:hypothetical protein